MSTTRTSERKVIQAIIPGPVVDLRALPGCAQDTTMGNLTGGRHMADLETLSPAWRLLHVPKRVIPDLQVAPSMHGQGARPKPARGGVAQECL
jgi:hypothetical protein